MKGLIFCLSIFLAHPLVAAVVINELAYHPPDERDDLQFVELHNAGSAPADISGWKFTAGIEFQFSKGTSLAPGGFLVVARDPAALAEQYHGVKALGPFRGALKHSGERVTLSDAAGKPVDSVKYGDRAPWPVSADGSGPTLERVAVLGRSDDPANWAPSKLPDRETPTGSPGRANGRAQGAVPASVPEVTLSPWQEGRAVRVSARVEDSGGVEGVTVYWSIVVPGQAAGGVQETVAQRVSGDARSGRYETSLPALPAGQFLRYRLGVKSTSGAIRSLPDLSDLRPTYTLAGWVNTNTAAIPQFLLFQTGAAEGPGNSPFNFWRGRNSTPAANPTRGATLLVVLPADGEPVEVFDYIRLTPRSGGWKVRFHSDHPWHKAHILNVIFESKPRWLLAEFLAYELFRRADVPAPDSGHVRLTLDGRPLGYHLWIEQPSKAFLQRHHRDPSGELYKAVWYGNSIEERHEKKTRRHTGHDELMQTIAELRKRTGANQWNYIQQEFDVPETINYYAVNLLIQNWDGFFNNHYWHHLRSAAAGGQKWQIYPWDEDKTWGDYDGASSKYDWYSMSLTYGSDGDREPGDWQGARGNNPWGQAAWWRPAGPVSGPLLANSEYRKLLRKRLSDLLSTEFTLEKFGPVIDALEKRLLPEARHRAELRGSDAAPAEKRLRADLDSFRRQLRGRGEYLRGELK